jgi:uroporphyrinogen-III synthase
MPIQNKTILCTRPAEDSHEFSIILEKAGAAVTTLPMIQIVPLEDQCEIDSRLEKLDSYSGLIFTSKNGVRFFFTRAKEAGISFRGDIYTVGDKTRAEAEKFGLSVNFVPESYDSASLAELLSQNKGRDSKYLFPCGNKSMKRIVLSLQNVEDLVVYETRKPERTSAFEEIEKMLINGKIDCVAFFSPSAVTNFTEFFPIENDHRFISAVIGNTTMERIRSLGLNANIVAGSATAESLAEKIIQYYNAG